MSRKHVVLAGMVGAALVFCTACGPGLIDATFTSRVVQHNTCKTVGDHPQTCTKDEATTDVRVTRLARGLPSGSVLEFANNQMLADALEGRRVF